MNYSEPDGEQYSIALVRKPAVVPPESEFYRGPILFNPGGPGGSGVDMIRGPRGEQFASILGPQFDILGFDPRGMYVYGHRTDQAFAGVHLHDHVRRNISVHSPGIFL